MNNMAAEKSLKFSSTKTRNLTNKQMDLSSFESKGIYCPENEYPSR